MRYGKSSAAQARLCIIIQIITKLQIVFILILTKIRTNATVTLRTTGQQGRKQREKKRKMRDSLELKIV